MRWMTLVVVATLAACGTDAGDEGEDGPPCYTYREVPGTDGMRTHCTDEASFCWWTGRTVTGDPERECSTEGAEVGCYYANDERTMYFCSTVGCDPTIINPAPSCP